MEDRNQMDNKKKIVLLWAEQGEIIFLVFTSSIFSVPKNGLVSDKVYSSPQ